MIARKWEPKNTDSAFFPVELRPIFMQSPATDSSPYSQLPRHFAVVDVKKNHPFAVVTDDYELVTNQQAYDQAAIIMQKVFQTTNFDDFLCLNITMPKTRSFCHIDLIHKSADFEPWEKDRWTAFLRITNSYNRTKLLRFELGFCRWICLNGMIFGAKSIEYSYSHSRRGVDRMRGFVENIAQIRKLEVELTEKLHQLQRYYVPETSMLAILCRAFDIKVSKEAIEKPRRADSLIALRKQVHHLTDSYFKESGPHGYAALNVLTDYATQPMGVIAPEASMHSLQQKCGNWMDDFVSSIQKSDFSFDRYLEGYRQTAELIESL
jgi:hypothetical protein